MAALEFYIGSELKKSINLGETRSYSSISLDFNESRTPNSVSCTFVVASIHMVVEDNETSTVTAQVDTGSGFVTIATAMHAFDVTGIAVGGTGTISIPISFIVPTNCSYKIISSGTGANTITSIYELTL